jgi:hypothetical protein
MNDEEANVEKTRAEIEKLSLENENTRKRIQLGLDNLEEQKAKLEVRSLQQKVDGKERASAWTKLQVVGIIAGVLASAILSVGSLYVAHNTYRKSLEDLRHRDFQTAVEHVGKGYAGGAIELARYGADGLQTLVYSVDPTGEREKDSWPQVTLVALDQLVTRKGDLTADQRAALVRDQVRNNDRLQETLLTFNNTKELEEKNEALHQATELLCIQKKLQQITSYLPDGWQTTERDVIAKLAGRPHC